MFKKILQIIMGQPQGFISDNDKFLSAFDEANPQRSSSQQAEIAKSQRIFELRDGVANSKKNQGIWRDF